MNCMNFCPFIDFIIAIDQNLDLSVIKCKTYSVMNSWCLCLVFALQGKSATCPVCQQSYPEHKLKNHIKTSHPGKEHTNISIHMDRQTHLTCQCFLVCYRETVSSMFLIKISVSIHVSSPRQLDYLHSFTLLSDDHCQYFSVSSPSCCIRQLVVVITLQFVISLVSCCY